MWLIFFIISIHVCHKKKSVCELGILFLKVVKHKEKNETKMFIKMYKLTYTWIKTEQYIMKEPGFKAFITKMKQ